ncbi:MAG: phosphotransferase, partial [Mycobacterium sp.]|nr:phosphotransferase [Mycobacterium sp.]
MLSEVITEGQPSTDAAVLRALAHWQLEPIVAVDRATSGVMNEIFIVTTPQRKVVLRKHRRPDRAQVDFEHAVIRHAIDRHIPTPAAIPSLTGESIVDHEGTYYSLFEHARGDQVSHDQLSAAHARSMGSMLARLHNALATFPVQPSIAPIGAIDPAAIRN